MFPKAGTDFLYKCERVEERDNYKANDQCRRQQEQLSFSRSMSRGKAEKVKRYSIVKIVQTLLLQLFLAVVPKETVPFSIRFESCCGFSRFQKNYRRAQGRIMAELQRLVALSLPSSLPRCGITARLQMKQNRSWAQVLVITANCAQDRLGYK